MTTINDPGYFAPKKIITINYKPPIPDRNLDWCAHFEGYEPGDLCGWGADEASAIADLKNQVEEGFIPSAGRPHP